MADTLLDDSTSFDTLRSALSGVEPEAAKTTEEPAAKEGETLETESPAVVEEPATTEEAAKEPEAVQEPVKKEKPKRFSELTRELEATRAERERLAAELAEARAGKTAPAEPAKAAPVEGKPVAPDADTWTGTWAELEAARAKYTEDTIAWGIKTALAQQEQAKHETEVKARVQSIEASWTAQVDEAMEAYEDVQDAIKNVGKVAQSLGIVEVIKESPVGVEIVRALHADKEGLKKLAGMSIASAAREIGRIEASIQAKQAAPATSKKLPDPPASVGGKASGSHKARQAEDMGIAELRTAVNRELRR